MTATDAAGNESQPSAPVNITVDTTAPDAPSQAAVVKDDVGIFTGDLSANAQTDDTRPALLVGTLPAGVTPVYLVDGMPVDATYDSNTGLLTPNDPIPQGQHTLAHAWRDPAGNTSASSPSTAVTIDTQAPATTAVITAATDDVGTVTGVVNSGGVTDDTRPALSGTLSEALAAGETLRVYDGATYLGNATVVGTDWEFSDNRGFSHGDSPSYSMRVTDAAGNRGTVSNSYSLNID